MSYMRPDVYYNPEDYGLEIVGEVDWSGGFYQYDLTVVWQDEKGQFYIGDDAGCSCPSPFEYVNSLEVLTKVSKFEAAERLQATLAERQQYNFGRGDNLESKTADLIAKIMKLGV